MKPVYQTKTGSEGNCAAACLASVLELPLNRVPRITKKNSRYWTTVWRRFLKPHGLSMVLYAHSRHNTRYPYGYAIAAHRKRNSKSLHAVLCYDGIAVHDPYRDEDHGPGKALLGVRYWIVFTVLDPFQHLNCKPARRRK